MTHRILITLSMFCFLLLSTPVESIGATGQDAKISYVLKNLSLKKDVVAKFRPLLVQYYQEIDKVKAPRKALKDKYKKEVEIIERELFRRTTSASNEDRTVSHRGTYISAL